MIAILLPETMGSLVRVKDRGIVWEAAGSIKMATAGSAVSCDGNVVLEEADILERATLRKRRRIPNISRFKRSHNTALVPDSRA